MCRGGTRPAKSDASRAGAHHQGHEQYGERDRDP